MQNYKSTRIITPSDMVDYGKSSKIRDVVSILNEINETNNECYTQKEAITARNHLMVMISFGNACRASNLINMTVQDVEKAHKEKAYDAWSFSSNNYKTSLLYGEKKILLGEDIYQQVVRFVKFLRPKISPSNTAKSSEQPLFTSVRGNGGFLTHSCISNAMTSLFHLIPGFASQER